MKISSNFKENYCPLLTIYSSYYTRYYELFEIYFKFFSILNSTPTATSQNKEKKKYFLHI
ncbi:hypothetical protein BpHYR1_024431 [Brachionus plicatilis]|uniref:Uncharacterized protein n=1 Tax=Brachionus plicatilis TaxID=10195 RepID=A0A3M7PML5_BRAPC|nr:hypothetical protein BpHYR1_024431 [Brachionus plicatilis]